MRNRVLIVLLFVVLLLSTGIVLARPIGPDGTAYPVPIHSTVIAYPAPTKIATVVPTETATLTPLPKTGKTAIPDATATSVKPLHYFPTRTPTP